MSKKLIYIFLIVLLCASNINAQTIAAGRYHSLSLCTDGTVRAWGKNDESQLGNYSTIGSTTPTGVTGVSGIIAVSAGHLHSMALNIYGMVWTWGLNSAFINQNINPSIINGLNGAVSIAAGTQHSIALKNDGTVWSCGYNAYGQLGDGTQMNNSQMVQAVGLTGVISIKGGNNHTIALKNDGTVWAWGDNQYGQLGDGTTNNRLTPVQVSGLTGVIAIACGWQHSIAIKNDGTVWAWGVNFYGQLGDGSTIKRTNPVQVSGLTGVVAIAGGYYFSLALKNDSTVWAWGDNWSGQLGDGTTTNRLTPVQVSNLTGVVAISGGEKHTIALKNDGSLRTWGSNFYGQLGDGTTIDRLTPVQTQNLCQVALPTGGIKGIYGEVYNDINQNCTKENGSLLAGRKLLINPGNIIVETNQYGYWQIDPLPAGNYTITADTSGKWKRTCPLVQNFTITNPDSFYIAPSFGFISTESCAEPQVSANMPRMRPGFSNQPIYLQACNEYDATGALINGYIELELDPLIIPQSASVSYTSLGGNKYKFVLANNSLNPGQCESITVSCSLSTSAVLNSTLCIKANLYPADSCVFDTIPNIVTGVTPCTLPWDKSSLKVTGKCTGDSVRFVVYNHGSGDMDCYAPVRIYINGLLAITDSIKLVSGDSAVYTFLGDGRAWRLEADQHPLHPGNSHPNATIEKCGSGTWTPGLVNVLPQDDADPVVDIYCGVVTGSYDPNDKTGYPLGVDTAHNVLPNQQMEYVIRFQNTGTDTAFTVVIRDTLDTDLDIFSVVSGVSSHKYKFKMYGPRVLEWRFDNILLPDSNVNEAKSHGFVTFTVEQNRNLGNGTLLQNTAGIYFDYNAPVITNTTVHTVNDQIITKQWTYQQTLTLTDCESVSVNGYVYSISGSYYQVHEDTLFTVNVTINNQRKVLNVKDCDSYTFAGNVLTSTGVYFDTLSTVLGCDSIIELRLTIPVINTAVTQNIVTLTAQATAATYQWLDCTAGYTPINGQTGNTFTATANGVYAVIVTQNGCSDTSACYTITQVGLPTLRQAQHDRLRVYPNPATDELIVSIDASIPQHDSNANIEIYNVIGVVVKHLILNPSPEEKDLSVVVNISDLPKGMYVVKVGAEAVKLVVE